MEKLSNTINPFALGDVESMRGMMINLSSNDFQNHSLFLGTTGKGKSILSEGIKRKARKEGVMLVDTKMYREGKGLKPYEHEYARRLSLGIMGALPRELRGKKATFIIDQSSPRRKGSPKTRQQKRERILQQKVKTKSAILNRALIQDACDELSCTGVYLNHPQIIELMEKYYIDEKIEEYDEVETTIREDLSSALSDHLIGEHWPSYGDDKDIDDFYHRIKVAAYKMGYKCS